MHIPSCGYEALPGMPLPDREVEGLRPHDVLPMFRVFLLALPVSFSGVQRLPARAAVPT